MTETMAEVRICSLSAIPPGEGRSFSAPGEDIAVFHTRGGRVFATQAACPHKRGPLADGLVGGTMLICPLHAWKFDLSTGEAVMGECGLRTYPVRVDEEGQVILTLDTHTAC